MKLHIRAKHHHARPSGILLLPREQNICTNTTRKSRGERLRLYITLQVNKSLPEMRTQRFRHSVTLQENLAVAAVLISPSKKAHSRLVTLPSTSSACQARMRGWKTRWRHEMSTRIQRIGRGYMVRRRGGKQRERRL